MDKDIKREARRQFFRYFRPWLIAIAVLASACVGLLVYGGLRGRGNGAAPRERVYDYADVLTDAEEEKLRRLIARRERWLHIDIVIVTIRQSVEGEEAKKQYGYRSEDWEQNMMDLADDFWDELEFGYNNGFEGDGALLLHNWYEWENGEHISTSGRVERLFGMRDIDRVLDAVDRYYEKDPCRAYEAYINELCRIYVGRNGWIPWLLVFAVPLAAALVFAVKNRIPQVAKNTKAVNAYVAGGKPEVLERTDTFVRKNVSQRRIETASSSGRSGGSRGGGGHHVSRSGASHGGGSHRH